MFTIMIGNKNFEVESIHSNTEHRTHFYVYLNGEKQFVIEPTVVYGQGKEVIWKLSGETKDKLIDYSTIESLGNAIEESIN